MKVLFPIGRALQAAPIVLAPLHAAQEAIRQAFVGSYMAEL